MFLWWDNLYTWPYNDQLPAGAVCSICDEAATTFWKFFTPAGLQCPARRQPEARCRKHKPLNRKQSDGSEPPPDHWLGCEVGLESEP